MKMFQWDFNMRSAHNTAGIQSERTVQHIRGAYNDNYKLFINYMSVKYSVIYEVSSFILLINAVFRVREKMRNDVKIIFNWVVPVWWVVCNYIRCCRHQLSIINLIFFSKKKFLTEKIRSARVQETICTQNDDVLSFLALT